MWMMPLHLHVNQKSDYDDYDMKDDFVQSLFCTSNFQSTLPTGKYYMLFCSLQVFFKISIFEKIFSDIHCTIRVSNSLDTFCRPDLVPNCLQRLSAVNTSK